MKSTKIAIIGIGSVGSTIAYALLLKDLAAELILIDIDTKKCAGEVKDLSDALGLSFTSCIRQGTYSDAHDADIIIIAAGKPQKPGQSRSELIKTNKIIIQDVVTQLIGVKHDALVIMVTNPLDVLTYYAQELLPLPRSSVFGTGTVLDSFRLQHMLAVQYSLADESIQGFVLGEHGDSQLVAWSTVSVGGCAPDIDEHEKKRIAKAVREEASTIIEAKGATFYGIATVVVFIVKTIVFDEKRVLPLSWYNESFNVCLSMPAVLGAQGIERILPLNLTPYEHDLFKKSALTIRHLIMENPSDLRNS